MQKIPDLLRAQDLLPILDPFLIAKLSSLLSVSISLFASYAFPRYQPSHTFWLQSRILYARDVQERTISLQITIGSSIECLAASKRLFQFELARKLALLSSQRGSKFQASSCSVCLAPFTCGRLSLSDSAYLDLGNFLTGMMVVSGVAFPLALAHSGVIAPMACIMAVSGGALVYGTSESPRRRRRRRSRVRDLLILYLRESVG